MRRRAAAACEERGEDIAGLNLRSLDTDVRRRSLAALRAHGADPDQARRSFPEIF